MLVQRQRLQRTTTECRLQWANVLAPSLRCGFRLKWGGLLLARGLAAAGAGNWRRAGAGYFCCFAELAGWDGGAAGNTQLRWSAPQLPHCITRLIPPALGAASGPGPQKRMGTCSVWRKRTARKRWGLG